MRLSPGGGGVLTCEVLLVEGNHFPEGNSGGNLSLFDPSHRSLLPGFFHIQPSRWIPNSGNHTTPSSVELAR